jgi:NADPH2:quinone reductase
VEVHATSVNPVDVKIRQGSRFPREFPLVQGYDLSGVVLHVGSAVHHFKPGDEVIASPNVLRPGANAERVAIDSRTAGFKPKNLDHVTAACLPLAGITAWESLHKQARIPLGATAMIHAGAGGVGHLEIQLAKLHGCRVITTAGREDSLTFCRDVLKADHVINYRDEDVVNRIKELTGGLGAEYVFDNVGGQVFEECLDSVATYGHIVTILGDDSENIGKLFLKNASLHFEFMGGSIAYGTHPEAQGEALKPLVNLAEAGLLKPHVSHVFELGELAQAHAQVETGRTVGKVAVRVK